MLIKADKKLADEYREFAYGLSQDLSRSSFPTYLDGLKTKEDFMQTIDRTIGADDVEILLYEDGGEVVGWIHYYWEDEDKYVGFFAFYTQRNTAAAIDEFLDYAGEKYAGYEIDFGFPKENREAIKRLEERGFTRAEDSELFVLHFDEYRPCPESDSVVKVDESNWDDFCLLHDKHDDMYWNSERLHEALLGQTKHRWTMYLFYDGTRPVGNIYFIYVDNMMEIFGIDGDCGAEIKKQLLIKALNTSKADGLEHLSYFAEEDAERRICRELGLTYVTDYVLYWNRA